jgi:hypothetical protein
MIQTHVLVCLCTYEYLCMLCSCTWVHQIRTSSLEIFAIFRRRSTPSRCCSQRYKQRGSGHAQQACHCEQQCQRRMKEYMWTDFHIVMYVRTHVYIHTCKVLPACLRISALGTQLHARCPRYGYVCVFRICCQRMRAHDCVRVDEFMRSTWEKARESKRIIPYIRNQKTIFRRGQRGR